MKAKIKLMLLLTTLPVLVLAQTSKMDAIQPNKLECRVCHVCEQPTRDEPCLRNCPRFGPVNIHQDPDNAPEVVLMDLLSEMYIPVIFSHQLHAEMADMSGGCQVCHHFTAPDGIVPCRNCHPVDVQRADLNKPGLRGAYHRQCLGCHRDWSHDTKCRVCHTLKSAHPGSPVLADTTDIIGVKHPKIPEPERVVYKTASDEGAIVTFYHNEHSGLYNLKCVRCHQKESCTRCHDNTKTSPENSRGEYIVSKLTDQPHQVCFACHEDSKCSLCHSNQIKEPFDHAVRTGWSLKKYHAKLNCNACHKKQDTFKLFKPQCEICHSDWQTGNFKHSKTGLTLDDNHSDIECASCHRENRFSSQPVCDECHEDFSFPARIPGNHSGKKE